MRTATTQQIRSVITTNLTSEVATTLETYARLRELESQLAEVKRDLRGTIKSLSSEGAQAFGYLLCSELEQGDRYEWKDNLSYCRFPDDEGEEFEPWEGDEEKYSI